MHKPYRVGVDPIGLFLHEVTHDCTSMESVRCSIAIDPCIIPGHQEPPDSTAEFFTFFWGGGSCLLPFKVLNDLLDGLLIRGIIVPDDPCQFLRGVNHG